MTAADARIQQLQRPQIKPAGQLVAQAFHDDPLVAWAMPDASSRHTMAVHVFTRNVNYAWRYGRVETTAQTKGVAVWLKPGHAHMTVAGMLRSGMAAIPFYLGWRGFRRMRLYNAAKTDLHDQVTSGPHWYLLILAVAPKSQGQGLGKALVQPVFTLADRGDLPCYLETTSQHNLPVFERLGFELRRQSQVPQGGPHLWAMVRRPRPT